MRQPELTSQNLGKSLHPGVHFDELDVVQDLVHFLNTPISHGDALPPKVGCESGAEHLSKWNEQTDQGHTISQEHRFGKRMYAELTIVG